MRRIWGLTGIGLAVLAIIAVVAGELLLGAVLVGLGAAFVGLSIWVE